MTCFTFTSVSRSIRGRQSDIDSHQLELTLFGLTQNILRRDHGLELHYLSKGELVTASSFHSLTTLFGTQGRTVDLVLLIL